MFDGMIFDWAGTTVDFGSIAPVEAFRDAFQQHGITVTDEEIRQPMGKRKWDHIDAMLHMTRIQSLWEEKFGQQPTKKDVDAVYADFEPSLLKKLEQTTLKPETIEVAKALHEHGIKIGTTTGYNTKMMKLVVPQAKAAGYEPDFLVTPDDVEGYGRPYPYMIFRNMEHFGWTSVDRILKIGDTISDIEEGKNAGVHTAGVLVGSSVMGLSAEEYNSLSEEKKKEAEDKTARIFRKAGAEYILHDLHDLMKL